MNRIIFLLVGIVGLVGCGQQGSEVPVVKAEQVTAALFNPSGAPTVEFSVPDMMCPEGCGAKTKEILAEQPGVKDVLIEFESKTAVVAVEDGKFDSESAIAALVDHGFDHSTLKGDGSDKPQADTVQ